MSSLRTLALPILAAGLALPTAGVAARRADEAAIRQTIQHYFDGGRNADSLTLRKAFHPGARMIFVRDGGLEVVPIGEYITRVGKGKPGPATDPTRRRVVSIDVTGDAAVAKLEIARSDALLTDYMSLLQVDGRWVIVNKIFTRAASPRRTASE